MFYKLHLEVHLSSFIFICSDIYYYDVLHAAFNRILVIDIIYLLPLQVSTLEPVNHIFNVRETKHLYKDDHKMYEKNNYLAMKPT